MIGSSKESELVVAVLLYAARCWQDGDRHALRQMNFGAREAAAIAGLKIDDVARAQQLGAHCLDIRLNRDAFWGLLSGFERLREHESVQRELIARDASFEMMTALFGLGAREYARWRRILGLPISTGRPTELDEHTEHAIWRACEAHTASTESTSLQPADYLAVAIACDTSVRTVWRALASWSATDQSSAPTTLSEDSER
ncbi:MAG TPA: DUF2857 domain-containing protein [Woeseiaceae bacterium]|nr:DUF2857 domain-containing protein [Woeseiaceae bacterium]